MYKMIIVDDEPIIQMGLRSILNYNDYEIEIINVASTGEEAIEQIEDGHSGLYGNMEFSLLPVYDETATISEYLENGYLKVELKGAFAETFIAISKDTAKQIEAAQKRQARITEKAIAINTAKKLEAE